MSEIVLDKSFYNAEERCGYYVSEKMKHIWAVGLDLWYKFDSVCKNIILSIMQHMEHYLGL